MQLPESGQSLPESEQPLPESSECVQCGADLVFDPSTQRVLCPGCGFEMPIDLTPVPLPKHNFGQVNAYLTQISADQQPPGQDLSCHYCHERATFNATANLTCCPYCHTPIQADDLQDAPARFPADGVLPFRISQRLPDLFTSTTSRPSSSPSGFGPAVRPTPRWVFRCWLIPDSTENGLPGRWSRRCHTSRSSFMAI